MAREDPLGDLAPRDRVARAIVRESERTGAPVYLTLAHLPADAIRARFPLIADLCRRVGLDLATDRLPVSPAAHYVMGGVATDREGRTSIPGSVCRRRGRLHRRARRQPAREQLAARGSGVRRPGRRGDACRRRRRMDGPRTPIARSPTRRPRVRPRAEPLAAESTRGPHVARRRRFPRRRQPATGAGGHRAGLVRTRGAPSPSGRSGSADHWRTRSLADRRAPHRPGGASARGKPRQPLAPRFPGERRSTLETPYDRNSKFELRSSKLTRFL